MMGAVDITTASQARGEARHPGSQDKGVPRKVMYIVGGAMLVLLVVRLGFGGRVLA